MAKTRRVRAPKFILALPAWLWMLTFFLVPVAFIVVYSFGRKPGLLELRPGQINTIALDQWPQLDAYRQALDGAVIDTFRNTFQIAVIGTLACLVIALPFAYWLAVKVPERYRGVILLMILIPFWTNFLIRTIAWTILLFPDGWFSGLLQTLGLTHHKLGILDTRNAVQLGVIYNYLVLMILPLFVSLDRISPALRDASKDLGANRIRTFWQVTLPLAMPGLISGLLLVFIPLMGDYITASVLGGAKGTMVGLLVYNQYLLAQNWAVGSAMAMILIGVILATVGIAALVGLLLGRLIKRSRRVELTPVTT